MVAAPCQAGKTGGFAHPLLTVPCGDEGRERCVVIPEGSSIGYAPRRGRLSGCAYVPCEPVPAGKDAQPHELAVRSRTGTRSRMCAAARGFVRSRTGTFRPKCAAARKPVENPVARSCAAEKT